MSKYFVLGQPIPYEKVLEKTDLKIITNESGRQFLTDGKESLYIKPYIDGYIKELESHWGIGLNMLETLVKTFFNPIIDDEIDEIIMHEKLPQEIIDELFQVYTQFFLGNLTEEEYNQYFYDLTNKDESTDIIGDMITEEDIPNNI